MYELNTTWSQVHIIIDFFRTVKGKNKKINGISIMGQENRVYLVFVHKVGAQTTFATLWTNFAFAYANAVFKVVADLRSQSINVSIL
jgi:hypothetical protein